MLSTMTTFPVVVTLQTDCRNFTRVIPIC